MLSLTVSSVSLVYNFLISNDSFCRVSWLLFQCSFFHIILLYLEDAMWIAQGTWQSLWLLSNSNWFCSEREKNMKFCTYVWSHTSLLWLPLQIVKIKALHRFCFLFCFCFLKYKYCKETSVTRFVKLVKTVYWPHFNNFCTKKKLHWCVCHHLSLSSFLGT